MDENEVRHEVYLGRERKASFTTRVDAFRFGEELAENHAERVEVARKSPYSATNWWQFNPFEKRWIRTSRARGVFGYKR